jgi:hypothetical protein
MAQNSLISPPGRGGDIGLSAFPTAESSNARQGSKSPWIGYNTRMRRLLPVLALAALALPAGSAATTPKLSVTDRSPFTIKGVGFAPREHIRIVVNAADGTTTKWGNAGSGGGIAMQLPGVKLGRCSAYVVRAFGAKGSRAVLRFMPECPQPFDP